ncbi:MAG: GNAT family N-acetyltransferase [Verrucomicrobiales bacterium]
MSRYVLEPLAREHDRRAFHSGLESIDRYLKETARGHTEKGISVTRVLTPPDASPPKPILGFITLSQISVEARSWVGAKGLPRSPVSAVLLGRMGVAEEEQGKGLSRMLVASACQLARDVIAACGGIGLVVDAANEDLIGFYEKFGFVRVEGLRMLLSKESLRVATRIE